jgi:hypothetical protein
VRDGGDGCKELLGRIRLSGKVKMVDGNVWQG